MRKRADKLSREDWIKKSLEILSEKGVVKLNIDQLAQWMRVSKGSFYWHFKSRSVFIKSLFEYWAESYTYLPANKLTQDIPDPEERLRTLLQLLAVEDYARYDLTLINWGLHEAIAYDYVQQVLEFRLSFIRDMFTAMGFNGADAEMRTHLVVTFQSMEFLTCKSLSKEERLDYAERRFRMLTAR